MPGKLRYSGSGVGDDRNRFFVWKKVTVHLRKGHINWVPFLLNKKNTNITMRGKIHAGGKPSLLPNDQLQVHLVN